MNKTETARRIDKMVGEGDFKKIDLELKSLYDNYEKNKISFYEENNKIEELEGAAYNEFIFFLVGYLSIFKDKSKNWHKLHEHCCKFNKG